MSSRFSLLRRCYFKLLGGNRRPIPPYKPLPPATDSVLNREKEQADKNKHKIDPKPEPSTEEATTKKEENDQSEATTHDNIENATKRYEENNNGQKIKADSNSTEKATSENSTKRTAESEHPAKKENKHQAPSKENASTSVTGSSGDKSETNLTKHEDPPKSVIPLEIPAIKPTKSLKIGNSQGSSASNEKVNKANISKTLTKSYSTSTLNIETSSSVQIIESTTTKSSVVQSTNDDDSSNVTSSTIALQPSKSAELESTSIATSIPTPTENLPSPTFTKTSSSAEKSIAHTPASNTFSKNSGRKSARVHVKFCSFCKIILHSIYNEFLTQLRTNEYA